MADVLIICGYNFRGANMILIYAALTFMFILLGALILSTPNTDEDLALTIMVVILIYFVYTIFFRRW